MTWHTFLAWYTGHWILAAPLTFVAYVVIGTLNALAHEVALRRLNRTNWETASFRRKALAYFFFPLSSFKTEHDRAFYYYDGERRKDSNDYSDKGWVDFRNGFGLFWPFVLCWHIVLWIAVLGYGIGRYVIGNKYSFALIFEFCFMVFNLPSRLAKRLTEARKVKHIEPPIVPTIHDRIAVLRVRISARELERESLTELIQAEKAALDEAETEAARGQEAYRDLPNGTPRPEQAMILLKERT